MRIDLAVTCIGIGLALVVIPLFVGYTTVSGTVPPPASVAFYGLAGVVMAPGLLMGTGALWIAARSDPS